jgi:hypothetical protein
MVRCTLYQSGGHCPVIPEKFCWDRTLSGWHCLSHVLSKCLQDFKFEIAYSPPPSRWLSLLSFTAAVLFHLITGSSQPLHRSSEPSVRTGELPSPFWCSHSELQVPASLESPCSGEPATISLFTIHREPKRHPVHGTGAPGPLDFPLENRSMFC